MIIFKKQSLEKLLMEQAARLIRFSKYTIALTGAGISAESGIPTFRGHQGLWERYDPMEYASIGSFIEDPEKVWKALYELDEIMQKARPNPAHFALAELEKMGYLKAIITQNVDGLHQAAGSKNVIEFHGSAKRLICLNCGRVYQREEIDTSVLVPRCKCNGLLKPDVVFFGEPIPEKAMELANQEVDACDLMLVIGTSAEVVPASILPWEAKRSGAKIIEVNLSPTNLTDEITDIFLQGPATKVLTSLLKKMTV